MSGSALAGVPRTCRDTHGGQVVSEVFMFATCGTVHLVGYTEPMTKAFVDDEGLEDTSVFIACSMMQSCIRKQEHIIESV